MPTDDDIRRMLQARADRSVTTGLLADARVIALATGRGRMDRWHLRRPFAAAAAALAVVLTLTLSAVVITPRQSTDHGSAPASGGRPSVTVQGSPERTVTIRCVDVTDEVCDGAVAAARPLAPDVFSQSSVLVFDGCAPGRCIDNVVTVLVGVSPGWRSRADLRVVSVSRFPINGHVDRWPQSRGLPERLIQLLPPPAHPSPNGTPAWTVAQLKGRPRPWALTDVIVQGWIAAGVNPRVRCAPGPRESGGLRFACGRQDWLTDFKFQPWQNGKVIEPLSGFLLPAGSYEKFAPNPTMQGNERAPRFGVWVARVGTLCQFMPNTDCAGGWQEVAEIQERISP